MLNKLKNKYKTIQLNIIKQKIRNTECKYKVYVDDTKKFENKIAIVTGGSGAIGSAICFKLAMEGATVIVVGRNVENLNSVVNQIKDNGGKAEICEMDVTDENSIKDKFDEIYKKYKRIDILVNNAGGSARKQHSDIINQEPSVIKDLLNLNLNAVIFCCKYAAKYMIEKNKGRIINIGSTVGVGGLEGFSEYCAAKSGVIGFTKSFAMEVADKGITVNCVSPGITNQIIWDKGLEDFPTSKTYTGRIGKTDDIANAVEFFCRDESDYIIGQNLIVDGGRSLGLKN